MPHKLELSIECKGDILCIELEGQLAAGTADRLVSEIDTTICSATRSLGAVILNCNNMDYVSGFGWHSILLIGRLLRSRGIRLMLVGLQPQIRIIFDNCNFLGLLSIHDSIAEAQDSLS